MVPRTSLYNEVSLYWWTNWMQLLNQMIDAISPTKSKNGANAVQRCSVEKQKGCYHQTFYSDSVLLILIGTLWNIINALLALNWQFSLGCKIRWKGKSWNAYRVLKCDVIIFFFFCISAFSWPYFGRAWWKTSTHQIWHESVHGGPRYGHMNT